MLMYKIASWNTEFPLYCLNFEQVQQNLLDLVTSDSYHPVLAENPKTIELWEFQINAMSKNRGLTLWLGKTLLYTITTIDSERLEDEIYKV